MTRTHSQKSVCRSQILWLSFFVLGGVNFGCSPLSSGGQSLSGCTSGNVIDTPGLQVGLAQAGIGSPPILVAQSFLSRTAQTITSVSVNLDTVVPAGFTLTGIISMTLMQDASASLTNPSPTAPNGAPFISNGVSATDSEDISTISSTPSFVTFTIGAPISLSANTIYWIVLQPSYPPSSTTYVEWRGSAISNTTQVSSSSATAPSSGWTSLSRTLDFKIGC